MISRSRFLKMVAMVLSVSSIFRYIHDGSETLEDNIEFMATDGTNSVTFILNVKVAPLLLVFTG